MKKHLLVLFSAAAIMGPAMAQEQGEKLPLPAGAIKKQVRPGKQVSNTRTVSCGPDTIVYPYLKELVFTAPNDSFFVDAMVGNIRTASQAYHLNAGSVNVTGIQFYGAAYSTSLAPQTLQVRAYLYNVDAMNMPTTKIDSVTITVTQVYDFYAGAFATPQTVSGNFAVAVKSIPSDTLAVITNNAGNVWSTDYSEGLAWRRFGSGAWNSSLAFFGQDLEYMIFPIVTYDVTASYTSSATQVCNGTPVSFSNTSSPLYDNRMLNLYAFDEYWGFDTSNASYSWNYGMGPAWTESFNGSYTFTSSGNYTVSLAGEMMGYYNSCSDTAQTVIGVDTVDVTVSSSGATITAAMSGATYQWIDCATNTAMAGETSQMFTATVDGDYAVVVTSGTCSDTSNCVNIVITGVNENAAQAAVSVYPNPSRGILHVNTPGTVAAQVTVTNLMGELVYTHTPTATVSTIDLGKNSRGIYFVRVKQAGSERTFKVSVQ